MLKMVRKKSKLFLFGDQGYLMKLLLQPIEEQKEVKEEDMPEEELESNY